MLKRLTLLLSIFVPAVSCAQSSFTTVTGVVQDPLANVYQNGTFSVNFFDPGTSGKQPLLPGNQPFQTQYSGSLDSFGAFSVNLPDNGVIATASGATGTTWQFFMCANPGILRLTTTNPIPCFSYSTPIVCATNTPTTCTSGTINITAQLKAVAAYLPVLNATAAAKPILPYNPIQYVSQNGSDANDGLSWGTSKATVYAALLALPGGGSGVSGSGTVFVGPLAATNPTANAGIWLMGPLDPNYASPPAGWLKCDTCTVSVVGVGTTSLGYANEAPTVPITGGGTADRNHPAIWLSGLNQRFTAQNIAVSGSQRPIVIGECSNNSRTGCLAFGTLLDKVSSSVTVVNASSGPSIDLANTTFVTIKNGSCHGSAGAVAGHTADNAANVLQVGGSLFMQNEELFRGGVKVTGTQIADYITDVDEYGDFTNIMPPVVWFTNYSTLSDAVMSGITGQCISCGSAASDLFNRANENPIASPWIAPGANPLPRLFSNTMTVASTAIQSDLALYSGITWPNDQYEQTSITQLKQGAGYIAWVLRCDAGGQNYYYVDLDASPLFGGIGIPTPLNLQKVVAGVLQGPPYAGLGFVTPQIGDIFKVQIIGNQISVFQNGTLVATYVDNTSPITSGSAGMFLQSASGISAITDVAIDNWAGGSTVPAPSIQVDGASAGTGPVLLGGAGTSVVGPALMLTDFPYYYVQATNKAISQRQTGFINRYMLGETDVARRIAGFLPVRFANKADTNSANWTSPSNTITLAQTDPFGGTGAAKFHTTTTPGSVSAVFGATAAYTPAINDWIVGGAWIKGGITGGVALSSPGVTFTTQVGQAGIDAGDGNEWTWQYIAYKVAANASATTLQLYHPYFSTGDIYLYGPVLYVLPAASVSDDEALWFANTASSIDTSCAVGNICNVSGHPLQVVGLTSGNCVQASTGGLLTTTGTPCNVSFVTNTNTTTVTANANTANDQNLMVYAIPAGALNSLGRMLRFSVSGQYSTAAASTSAMRLSAKLCTVSGCGSGTVVGSFFITTSNLPTVTITSNPFTFSGEMRVTTTGGSGIFTGQASLVIDLDNPSVTASTFLFQSPGSNNGPIDLSLALFLQITGAFTSASASNSMSERGLSVEIIN